MTVRYRERREQRDWRGRQAGFTFIEILVVMVILAILAAIIVPRLTGRSEQARRAKAVSDIENLGVALDTYEADNGVYPTTEQGLQALIEQPTTDPVPQAWHGPYVKKANLNDPWGRPYTYASPGERNPSGYDLYSYGSDGQEGGTGNAADVTNWEETQK